MRLFPKPVPVRGPETVQAKKITHFGTSDNPGLPESSLVREVSEKAPRLGLESSPAKRVNWWKEPVSAVFLAIARHSRLVSYRFILSRLLMVFGSFRGTNRGTSRLVPRVPMSASRS